MKYTKALCVLCARVGMLCTLVVGSSFVLYGKSSIFEVHDEPLALEEQGEVGARADKPSPQEKRGPQLDLDLNKNSIVTFKAEHLRAGLGSGAMSDCEAMLIMPSAEAIKKGVVLKLVFNNRLPSNWKWTKDTEIRREFPFMGPVRIYYDDAGTMKDHGGWTKADTDHNWGYRLLVDGKLAQKADYIRYIRHGYATAVPSETSTITISEGETLVKQDDLAKAFDEDVLQPLKEKIANNEAWSGTFKGFNLVMVPTVEGEEHGLEGSLDDYLTHRANCNNDSFSQSDGWTFIQLKKAK